MNEYEARLRTVVEQLIELRGVSGTTISSLFLGLLTVLLSKNKITAKDLDIIFEAERQSAEGTMKDIFAKSYGDPEFPLRNEGEIDDVIKMYDDYLQKNKSFVTDAAKEIEPRARHKKKSKQDLLTEGKHRASGIGNKPTTPKPDISPAGQKQEISTETPKRPTGRVLKENEDPAKKKGEQYED